MATRRKSDTENKDAPDMIGASPFPETPMFPNLGVDEGMIPAKILVFRIDPPDGLISPPAPPNADEEFMESVYGGRVLKLSLRAENGRVISEKTITINSPAKTPHTPGQPVAAVAPGDAGAAATQAAIALQREMVREQRSYHDAQLAMLTATHQAGLDRAKQELELSLTRQRTEAQLAIAAAKADADAREDREQRRADRDAKEQRDRHERDMAKMEADRKTEIARVEQSRRDDEARNQQFMLHMQAADKEKTAIIMAALQANNSRQDSVEQMKGLAEVAQLMGGGAKDPNVAMAEAASGVVSNLAGIVAADREGAREAKGKKQNPAAQQAKVKVAAAPTKAADPNANGVLGLGKKELPDPDDVPAVRKSMEETLASLAAQLQAQGHNPLEVLQKIESGELTIVDAELAERTAEYLDSLPDEGADVAAGAVAGDTAPNGTSPAPPVANGERADGAGANAPVVGSRGEGDGRPAAT